MKISLAIFGCLMSLVVSANAQKQVVPIVELTIGGLAGGTENGRWLNAKQTAAKLKKENEFVLIGWRGAEEGGVSLGKMSEPEIPCEEFYPVELELKKDSGVALGTSAKWNPVPRIPAPIDANNRTYKNAVADVLKSKGIAKTIIKITEAYRIDLDADGREEVVLAATYYKNGLSSSARIGDYSFILLRKIVNGKVQNILVGGDFITKNIDFGAPNEVKLSTIADLNGDGKMELIIYGRYYEGHWVEIIEVKGNSPTKVLETGCGV